MVRKLDDRADAELVRCCLEGDSEAWDVLVHRYKNLIYSIPTRWGLDPEDCAEVFQSAWSDCFYQLSSLKNPQAFAAWLMRIAIRRCYGVSNRRQREVFVPIDSSFPHADDDPHSTIIDRIYKQQVMREAIVRLSPRCGQLIQALFFEDATPTYADLARRFDLATNSIGFTRDRCLERLGKILVDLGFKT